MARPTKQAKATRRLLDLVRGGLAAQGLSEVDNFSLITAATALAIKSNDKKEEVLFVSIMDELESRDLTEVDAELLLSAAVSITTKGGTEAKDEEMSLKELKENKQGQVGQKRVRC